MKAVYLRTSTGKQDGAAQRDQLQRAVGVLKWSAVEWYEDRGESGKKASRPALDKLLTEVRAGKVTHLLVYRLDRLGRSMVEVCLLIEQLSKAGVRIHSLREGILENETPMGRAMIQLCATFAEMEHGIIAERVKSGIERARKNGTRSGRAFGRPLKDIPAEVLARARRYRKSGASWREIAVALKVKVRTLRDRLEKGTQLKLGEKKR